MVNKMKFLELNKFLLKIYVCNCMQMHLYRDIKQE